MMKDLFSWDRVLGIVRQMGRGVEIKHTAKVTILDILVYCVLCK